MSCGEPRPNPSPTFILVQAGTPANTFFSQAALDAYYAGLAGEYNAFQRVREADAIERPAGFWRDAGQGVEQWVAPR